MCAVVLRAVRAGGNLNNGGNVSPLYFNCNNAVETSNFNYGGGHVLSSRSSSLMPLGFMIYSSAKGWHTLFRGWVTIRNSLDWARLVARFCGSKSLEDKKRL